MKLIFCKHCHDIVLLRIKDIRKCLCGKASGQYVDDLNAEINENCIPIGINNFSFVDAIKNQPKKGDGFLFEAFVIPKKCPTIRVIKK